MNAANVILRGFTPCFFAICAALSFSAAMCGAAISFALSYEIAPTIIHIFILCSCSVCSIGCSFGIFANFVGAAAFAEVKAGGFIIQGVCIKYFKKTVKNPVSISDWRRYA